MAKALIADFVSVFSALQMPVAKWLKAQLQRDGSGSYQDVYVVAKEGDKSFLLKAAPGINIWPLKAGEDQARAVFEAVLAVRAQGKHSELTIASHKAVIRQLAVDLGTDKVLVTGFNLSAARAPGEQPGVGWQQVWDTFITKDAALDLLRQILNENRAVAPPNAYRQVNLRIAFAERHPAFAIGKEVPKGLMKTLVTLAESAGWLEVDRTSDPSNHRFWLRSGTPTQPDMDPVAHTATDGPRVNHEAVSGAMSATRPEPDRPPSKRDRMERKIKDRRLGPYTTLRLAVYQVLPEVLADLQHDPEWKGLPLYDLLNESKDRALKCVRTRFEARQQAVRDGEQPWRDVVRFLSQVMTRAKVALGADGKPIQLGSRGMTDKVKSLQDGWDRRVDAELMYAYLCGSDGLPEADFADIGGVLFHDYYSDGETRLRVADLVNRLVDEGRVEEHDDESGYGFVYRARPALVNRLLVTPGIPVPSLNGNGHIENATA